MDSLLTWDWMKPALDELPMLFIQKDTENNIIRVNRPTAKAMGVEPEDMANTPAHQWFSDQAGSYYQDDLEVISTRQPKLGILQMARTAGSKLHWIRSDKFPLFGTTGAVEGILVVSRDLSAVFDGGGWSGNEAKLREFLGCNPSLVFVLGESGTSTEFTGDASVLGPAAVDLFESRGENGAVPELARAFRTAAGRLQTDSDSEELEYELEENGETRVFLARAVRFDRNRRREVLFACWDRTQSRRREAELFETQTRLATIVESEPECVKVVSSSGILLDMNPAGLRMIEADALSEARGLSVFDLVMPEHRDKFQALHEHVIAGGSGVLEFEIIGLKGTRRWVETNAAPLCDRDGVGNKHIAITRDITEAKRAEAERSELEAQLRHVQKLESIGVLAGGIAHDFNNHLTAILANADFALGMLDADSPARESIDACVKSSRHAAEVCDQLLTYAGRQLVLPKPTNLSQLVEKSLKLLQLSISKSAELDIDLAPDLPAVNVDTSQIRQLLVNLVTNASEALHDSNGSIKLWTGIANHPAVGGNGTSRHGLVEYVFIEVKDDGCGMPSDILENIFDPFFTTKFTGRGLGLATVLGTVRGHGGFIETESSIGIGTRIRVHFPSVAAVAVEPTMIQDVHSDDLSGTILVVDDDPAVREIVARVLEYSGLTVLLADGGEAALALFAERAAEITAAILDHTMPGMRGSEVCARLRELRPDLPVLYSSGHPEELFGSNGSSTGPIAYLKKPYRPAELLSKLEQVMSMKQ